MKVLRKLAVLLAIFGLALLCPACPSHDMTKNTEEEPVVPVTGIALEKKTLTMTIFGRETLNFVLSPPNASVKEVRWSSSNPNVASVSDIGIVTALNYTTGGTSTDSTAATGSATITVKTVDGNFSDSITITTTMAGQADMMTLPPLKEQFSDYFMIGNIFNPTDAVSASEINNILLTYHYNILTHENNMKPSYLCNALRGSYNMNNLNTAMRMIDAAIADGIKIQGHTLLWHSQIPFWQSSLRNSGTASDALQYMQEYITYIVTFFKGKIYGWDVLNEAFPDNVGASADWKQSMRDGSADGNPWFMRIGAGFVYEAFKAARLADPGAILYYNDYNMDNENKARVVANMVHDVNAQWLTDPEYDNRLLIEGIGMQSHHNITVPVARIKASLDRFRELGVKISITELDVLSQSWDDFCNNPALSSNYNETTTTNNGRQTAASLYGQYFRLFLENANIIERVTFWGVCDEQSWRAKGRPLLFEGAISARAKPAYYEVIGALEQ